MLLKTYKEISHSFLLQFYFIPTIVVFQNTSGWNRTNGHSFIRTAPSPLGYASKIQFLISLERAAYISIFKVRIYFQQCYIIIYDNNCQIQLLKLIAAYLAAHQIDFLATPYKNPSWQFYCIHPKTSYA